MPSATKWGDPQLSCPFQSQPVQQFVFMPRLLKMNLCVCVCACHWIIFLNCHCHDVWREDWKGKEKKKKLEGVWSINLTLLYQVVSKCRSALCWYTLPCPQDGLGHLANIAFCCHSGIIFFKTVTCTWEHWRKEERRIYFLYVCMTVCRSTPLVFMCLPLFKLQCRHGLKT